MLLRIRGRRRERGVDTNLRPTYHSVLTGATASPTFTSTSRRSRPSTTQWEGLSSRIKTRRRRIKARKGRTSKARAKTLAWTWRKSKQPTTAARESHLEAFRPLLLARHRPLRLRALHLLQPQPPPLSLALPRRRQKERALGAQHPRPQRRLRGWSPRPRVQAALKQTGSRRLHKSNRFWPTSRCRS